MKKKSTWAYSAVGAMTASLAPKSLTMGSVKVSPPSIRTAPHMNRWITDTEKNLLASVTSPSPRYWAYSVDAPDAISIPKVLTSI